MSSPPPPPECDDACLALLKILLDGQGNASRLDTWLDDVQHLHRCVREHTAVIPVDMIPLLPTMKDKTQQVHDLVKELRGLWRQGHGEEPPVDEANPATI